MTNAALISELVDAKEPSRALSDEVLLALGWTCRNGRWCRDWDAPGKPYLRARRYHPTGNLKDIADLVPEGEWWSLSVNLDDREICEAEVGGCSGDNQGLAPTPALALSISILKAMETEDG